MKNTEISDEQMKNDRKNKPPPRHYFRPSRSTPLEAPNPNHPISPSENLRIVDSIDWFKPDSSRRCAALSVVQSRIERVSCGVEFFRRRNLLYTPTRCRRVGKGGEAAIRPDEIRSSGCHECVGFHGSQFGCCLTIERISHIVRYPSSISSDRWIVFKLNYVDLGAPVDRTQQAGPSQGRAAWNYLGVERKCMITLGQYHPLVTRLPTRGIGSSSVWEEHVIIGLIRGVVWDDVVCAHRTWYLVCELHMALVVLACELWSFVPRLDRSSLESGQHLKILRASQTISRLDCFPVSGPDIRVMSVKRRDSLRFPGIKRWDLLRFLGNSGAGPVRKRVCDSRDARGWKG
ncbi:unnamed protein product [Prunus armeniaca]